MTHADPIRSSNLPAEIQELIRTVVKRSRLWKAERYALTLELISHFGDGLEAGRSAEELIKKFGDAKMAAKLMRRAKKRNRPLWWQLLRFTVRSVEAGMLLYAGAGILLSLRHPNPTVDYVAELNRPAMETAVTDQAWPIYRKAWTESHIFATRSWDVLYLDDPKGKQNHFLMPGDTRWSEAAAYLQKLTPLLDAMRKGAAKPSLGWIHTKSMDDLSTEDHVALFGKAPIAQTPTPSDPADKLLSQSVISVRIPYLAPMRVIAELIAADMRLAASEGDAARVVADYRALAGMARQCSQSLTIVSQLVGLGILALADDAVVDIDRQMPDKLVACRVDLLHAMAGVEPALRMDLSWGRWMLLDDIQRIYSNNESGDGALTLDGLRMFRALSSIMPSLNGRYDRNKPNTPPIANIPQPLVLPTAAAVMPSRREITEKADQYYSLCEEDAARPLWVQIHAPWRADDLVRQWKSTSLGSARYALLVALLPALDKAPMHAGIVRAKHDATVVVLALEAYRDRTGSYPRTLAELVPHYLPSAPLDYSTGEPLRYKLMDGKPLLYGLGRDGVDDGGVWTDKEATWPQIPETGDWVLYPRPEATQPAKQ